MSSRFVHNTHTSKILLLSSDLILNMLYFILLPGFLGLREVLLEFADLVAIKTAGSIY